MVSLPKAFTARPATLDDVESAVELANLCSIEWIGRPEFVASEFRNDWQSPSVNPETDLRLVFAPDGTLVGYGGVWDSEPHVQIHSWGNVHPAYRGQGIGTYLAAWVEARARSSIVKATPGARVTVGQMKAAEDTPGRDLLLASGYTLIRHFLRMEVEMDAPPPEPTLPEGIVIRTLADLPGTAQERLWAVVHAERDIFRDHWSYVEMPLQKEYDEWLHWIEHDPDHDPALWFLAMDGDELVGVSLCQPKMAEDADMSYVMSLGVRRPWRRKGVALALLHHSFGEFYRRDKRKVALDVDAHSLTSATRLYEKAGMHLVRQSAVYEKELRSGVDLSTQSLAVAEEIPEPEVYPLTFEPVFRDYIWGGRNLETLLGRKLPPGIVAESWDISGHPSSPTPVDAGALAGLTLPQVLDLWGEALVGTRSRWATDRGKFPLLVKLLDANRPLSVQVHPSDEYALAHEKGELGKAEMWYVLHAKPGAELIYGLSQETTPEAFRTALASGALADHLHRLPVQAGDALLMPTGTVHALLEGIVVAEIQQNSDTTYRVYDWGRVGADGKPRPLHVDKALEVIDFGMVRPQASRLEVVGGRRGLVRFEIARCPYFVVEKVELEGGGAYRGRCDGSTFEIWGSVVGSAQVRWAGDPVILDAVRFALLPAALGEFTVQAGQPATLLRAYAPE